MQVRTLLLTNNENAIKSRELTSDQLSLMRCSCATWASTVVTNPIKDVAAHKVIGAGSSPKM